MLMQKLKTKLRQFVYVLRRDFLTAQNILLCLCAAIALFFVTGAISSTSHIWSLQTKLNTIKAQEALVKIEVEKLRLEQQYYNTEEYQELMARKKLGKMAEGETMVILENNSQAAKEKYKDSEQTQMHERSNFAQWLDLLL